MVVAAEAGMAGVQLFRLPILGIQG